MATDATHRRRRDEFPVVGGRDDEYFYVAHGSECVLLCEHGDLPRWRNSVMLTADMAEALGRKLIQQAERSRDLTNE